MLKIGLLGCNPAQLHVQQIRSVKKERIRKAGITKRKVINELENNPKNWITRKCVICKDAIKINVALEGNRANPDEPFICPKCLNKD